MKATLVHATQDAEKLIVFCARVSSPDQSRGDEAKLINYCIKHKHWSIFEMGSMCVEITTSRAIAQQILRHRSFHFQEFSQRYAEITSVETYGARSQDHKNRQNSVDDMAEDDKKWFMDAQKMITDIAKTTYEAALKKGIAKEQARFLLPLATTTKLYMHGTVRDWIHYINLRTENGTQLEHKEIADKIKSIFIDKFPLTAQALWAGV